MRKLAGFAVPFCLGVFLVQYLLPGPAVIPVALVCAAMAPVCLWLAPRGERRLRAVLALAGTALGLLWCAGYGQLVYAPAQALDGTTIRLEAIVSDWPKDTEYGSSVVVRMDTGGPLPVSVQLYLDGGQAQLRPGDRISTVASCRLADRVHGEEVTYYTAKGVLLVATAYGDLEVDRPDRVSPAYWPALLTRTLTEGIGRVFQGDESALARALVTGDKDGLSNSLNSQLRRVGLSHVVVVSGMHLSILIWAVVSLLGPGRRLSALVGGILILLVMGMAGSTPSVVRAGILQLFLLVGPLLGRRQDPLTTLSLALAVLLLANPYAAANVGLQLSFGAVLGLYLFAAPLQRRMADKLTLSKAKHPAARLWNGLVRLFTTALAATLAAQVFTIPLCGWYFGSISLIAPLANVLTLWAVTPAFLGGLLSGVLGCLLPGAGAFLALCTRPFLWWTLTCSGALSRLPFASLALEHGYYLAWLLLVYVLIALALLWRGPRRWLTPLCCAGVSLCAAILFTSLTFQTGTLTVSVLDVGQGSAVILRSGSYLAMVDCGGDSYDDPGDIAADYLSGLGRSRLDLLILTHFHTDHANGIPQLLDRVEVDTLAVPDVEPDSPLRQSILALAEEQGTTVWFIRDDHTVTLEDGTVFRLYPPLSQGDTNEAGLTVLCSAEDFDVLLTGDMGGEGEQLLLDQVGLPDIELLVVGHHGSKYSTSEALLERTRPELAVISVSRDNYYGHPTQEVLDRLDRAGAAVYRTDRDGTVTIHAGDTAAQ